MADYIIYRSGANTVARNTSTGTDQFTNAAAASVFNSCLSTLNTAGVGGNIYVKKGVYDIGSTITLFDNMHIVGEDRDKTTLNNTGSGNTFEKTGSIITNFALKNITIKSPGNGRAIYFAGGTRCVLEKCRFWYSSPPATATILVWFDSVNGTRQNYYNKIHSNIFEGSTNGQDLLGGGCMNWSTIHANTFIGPTGGVGAGQGIGHSGCQYVSYIGNTFKDVGNTIALEDAAGTSIPSMCNSIIGNTQYNCGKLKLSLENSSNRSLFCTCVGNTIIYGNGGIEDGNGLGDVIANNTIIRTTRDGIRGTFRQCTIEGNIIFETNHENANTTVGATSYKRGGIVLQNNTGGFLAQPFGTKVSNNRIFRSTTAYTYEPDGSSKTSNNGGILIDSDYNNTIVTDNLLYTLNTDPFRDHGANTVNRTNDTI